MMNVLIAACIMYAVLFIAFGIALNMIWNRLEKIEKEKEAQSLKMEHLIRIIGEQAFNKALVMNKIDQVETNLKKQISTLSDIAINNKDEIAKRSREIESLAEAVNLLTSSVNEIRNMIDFFNDRYGAMNKWFTKFHRTLIYDPEEVRIFPPENDETTADENDAK